ncbi:uncharacterized protein [Typha latifolia]|uniref:uncharacterized protein n=1 Tax=Typha latifolia TaxID=4733 RepID=UPI003C2AB348
MEASLFLRSAHFTTWRPEGLLAPNRHVAVVPNGRAIEMGPRHLVRALAQARQLTFGGGGWRRMDTWRRQLSSQAANGGDKPPSELAANGGDKPPSELAANGGDKPPSELAANGGDMPPTSNAMLNAMLGVLLGLIQKEYLNNKDHIINEIRTNAEKIVKLKEGDKIYPPLLEMQNNPGQFFSSLLNPKELPTYNDIYEVWLYMKEGEMKNMLGLFVAQQLICEKDYPKAMTVYESLDVTAPSSADHRDERPSLLVDERPSLLLLIICASVRLDLRHPWEEIFKYKKRDIPIEG